jgi:hypothetical protein
VAAFKAKEIETLFEKPSAIHSTKVSDKSLRQELGTKDATGRGLHIAG